MNTTGQLHADNRIHTLGPNGADRVGNEFDYDDPDFCELYGPMDEPWMNEVGLRALRDFILNCSDYVAQLERRLGDERLEFWEAREHAYHIVSQLLIELYEQEAGE